MQDMKGSASNINVPSGKIEASGEKNISNQLHTKIDAAPSPFAMLLKPPQHQVTNTLGTPKSINTVLSGRGGGSQAASIASRLLGNLQPQL